MTLRVAVDFGTSSTCIAMSLDGRPPQVVAVDGLPLLSSAVYAAPDGTLFVGQEAERQAAVDPSRFEPNPKRRIDETELLLGNAVVEVRDVVRAVLSRALDEARRMAAGVTVDQLVLTHPADWGGIRARVLRQAANGLADRIVMVPEPVAAAVFHAVTFGGDGRANASPGDALAVLDLGGGTVDVSVVRKEPRTNTPPEPGQGFRVLATKGDPSFGGADVDQALLHHVGSLVAGADPDAWRELVEGRELADRRRRRMVWQDVRGAKETLSRHAYTDVPLPPPFPDAHVTRADLEELMAGPLGRTAELAVATIREAGLRPDVLKAIFLVGGSSRIPMVARLVHERTGVVPMTLDQPETVVARGALLAVGLAPARPGPSSDEITEMDVTMPAVSGRDVASARTASPRPAGMPASGSMRTATPPPGMPQPRTPSPGTPVPGAPRMQPMARGPVGPPGHRYPPPPPGPGGSRRPNRTPWLVSGIALAAVLATVVLVLVFKAEGDPPPTDPGKVLAQYDYRFTLPPEWAQVGGDPRQREALIAPGKNTTGIDRIIVQERLLTYDSDANRDRAIGQLRDDYESQTSSEFTDLDESARFAGKDVVYYRQRVDGGTVDWYVQFKGTAQVSVGCQYTDAGRDGVLGACDQVVRTMTIG